LVWSLIGFVRLNLRSLQFLPYHSRFHSWSGPICSRFMTDPSRSLAWGSKVFPIKVALAGGTRWWMADGFWPEIHQINWETGRNIETCSVLVQFSRWPAPLGHTTLRAVHAPWSCAIADSKPALNARRWRHVRSGRPFDRGSTSSRLVIAKVRLVHSRVGLCHCYFLGHVIHCGRARITVDRKVRSSHLMASRSKIRPRSRF
jgi:hypothetical protein